MKATILRMLEFPRLLIRGNLDLERCRHAGNYAGEDAHCVQCAQRLDCQWLYSSDEFSALEQKSIERVVEALLFALVYVDVRVTRAGHRSDTCRCDACVWLRGAQRLFDAAGIYP